MIARILALAALLLSGCASLPGDVERVASRAMPASAETAIGRVAAASVPPLPDSGFRLMHHGPLALDARLQLIDRAERSLDVQYYHVQNDATGRRFMRALRDAAVRGVRVRLLIDDLYTAGEDELLLGLQAHGNAEVRLFNPFAARGGGLLSRFAGSLHEFDRVQRRMHNKLFVADGALAIAGGRNIGDEYYWQSRSSVFFDLDVLLAGPVTGEMANLFDRYWNSAHAYPAQAILRSALTPEALRERFTALVSEADEPRPALPEVDLLGYRQLGDELDGGRLRLQSGRARAYADSPDKVLREDAVDSAWDGPSEVRRALNAALQVATSEVVLITPYAVPGKSGMERLRINRGRGILVSILTNSLASTDEPVVHTGYRRYRKEMLEAGTELFELNPQRTKRLPLTSFAGDLVLRIHTKSAIIDRSVVFIGSLNFDQRSAHLNTEFGLLIDSPELARDVLQLVDALKRSGAYQLRLDAGGDLEWVAADPDGDEVLRSEPQSSWWRRLMLELMSVLVPESVL